LILFGLAVGLWLIELVIAHRAIDRDRSGSASCGPLLGERRARAIALFSEMVGALLLSRAVADADPALADEILETARTDLLNRTAAAR
jgi:hypothetical protein